MPQLELLSEHGCFGGRQFFYRHSSTEIGLPMRFALFMPPRASSAGLPMLMYLAGLTCTEETFTMKAGAQRMAAQLGIALLMPDTSPRGAGVPGEAESWDFGVGAGFYLDATREPWAKHWRMESYLMNELLPLVVESVFDRCVAHRCLRPFDGRPRRVDTRAPASGPLRFGLGVRPDRCSDAGTLGQESVQRIFRRRR